MTTWNIVVFILLYFLIGMLSVIAYVLAYKPDDSDRSTNWLGLIVITWPLAILMDTALLIASFFGRTVKIIHSRLGKVLR